MVSKLTSRELSTCGAACLYGFLTYLNGTAGWGCSLFIWFPNLSAADCWLEVQPVFYGFWTYLKGPVHLWCSTVGQRCSLLKQLWIYLQGTVRHGAAIVYGFQTYLQGTVSCGYTLFVHKVKNLLPENCKSGMQSVYKISEPTSRELSVWVQPFIWFPSLPPGDCQQVVQSFFTCS